MTNGFIDALRNCLPNTQIEVKRGGQRYGFTGKASTLVRDFDALTSDVEHWKAEAAKWQRIAEKVQRA